MPDYAKRQARLMDSLDVDAFLVVHLEATDSDQPSMFYLTGYPGCGVLMVTEDRIHAYASRTNIGMAALMAPHLDWKSLEWDFQNVIVSLLKEHGFGRVGLASRRMGMLTWRALEAANVCELVVEEDPILQIRAIKDAGEIEAIQCANEITEAALEETLSSIGPGITEAQIAWQLERGMRERGADGIAFELIVSAGAHTALPHHMPGDQPLKEGDVLLFDIGARFAGYRSDITRVVSFGRAPEAMREVYRTVLEANRAGIAAFAPGVSGEAVDQAARSVIEKAGYGDHFTHGLSHGVGIEVHELPVSEGAKAVAAYQPGMVCTVEPGVYLPDVGGVRIEDLVVITDDGCEVLSRFPKDDLIEIG